LVNNSGGAEPNLYSQGGFGGQVFQVDQAVDDVVGGGFSGWMEVQHGHLYVNNDIGSIYDLGSGY
jgi:hypothetical protein